MTFSKMRKGGRFDGRSLKAGLLSGVLAAGALASAPASAQSNGIGLDADGDTNPATDVHGFYQSSDSAGDDVNKALEIVTFEPPPGQHGDVLRAQYKKGQGVGFSRGLRLQKCDGQHYFRYNTKCTYEAPPSGSFAAVYHDDYRRPLRVRFDEPVCAAIIAMYPTGGAENEVFEVTLDFYRKSGEGDAATEDKIGSKSIEFAWTNNTVQWRNKVMSFLESQAADRVDISMRSLAEPEPAPQADLTAVLNAAESVIYDPATPVEAVEESEIQPKNIDFLIDDLAFIPQSRAGDGGCASVLDAFYAAQDQ